MSMDMDKLLRDAATAHNAALPLADWKARILAEAEAETDDPIPMENIVAFAPRKKPFYQRALPYAAAAAVAVMFLGFGAMGGFSRLRAPAAAAPAAAAGADMAAVAQAVPAEPAAPAAPEAPAAPAAPMEAAETEGFAIPDSLSEEANTYTTLEEPPVPAPAEPAAPAGPAEAPASESATADTEGGADNGASASSRSAMIEAVSGERRVALTAIAPGTTPEEMAELVSWIAIDPAAESVPFRLMQDGGETHGIYAVYDAETFEALDFFHPSGLAPETYLFQNAVPGGRYIVTVFLGGELYGFGAELS